MAKTVVVVKKEEAPERLNAGLIAAAISGDAKKVKLWLSKGASGMGADSGGFTALMWAARYGLLDAALVLIPVSDMEQRDGQGRRALEIAMEGSGEKSAVAGAIESWILARDEVFALSEQSHMATKRPARNFRL